MALMKRSLQMSIGDSSTFTLLFITCLEYFLCFSSYNTPLLKNLFCRKRRMKQSEKLKRCTRLKAKNNTTVCMILSKQLCPPVPRTSPSVKPYAQQLTGEVPGTAFSYATVTSSAALPVYFCSLICSLKSLRKRGNLTCQSSWRSRWSTFSIRWGLCQHISPRDFFLIKLPFKWEHSCFWSPLS